MSAKEIILSSIDSARGEANGWSRELWFTTTKNYGGVPSVTTTNGKFDGTTHQSYYTAEWQNSLIPVKYAAALKSYLALTDSEATIAANLAAANNALEAAQKALDDAIKANASVNELKVALDAALAALNEAKQVAFEAKVTHETEKAKNKNSTETADALAVRTEKEALQATAQATYDAAKAAFDAAVAADANLTALTTAVTDATAAQKTAQAPQTTVDNYKLYATQNEKFLAAYNEIANVALWDTEDMDNSAIVKAFAEVAEENRLLPTFTYYYDAATDTYTVFVTSAVDANLVEKF
jgi:hypothetical protein